MSRLLVMNEIVNLNLPFYYKKNKNNIVSTNNNSKKTKALTILLKNYDVFNKYEQKLIKLLVKNNNYEEQIWKILDDKYIKNDNIYNQNLIEIQIELDNPEIIDD